MTTPCGDLILVTGPSGVGKSTITEQLHQRLATSDWLLWQADRCSPPNNPVPSGLTHQQMRALEDRKFSADIAAIAAYLNHGWSVVAELTVMSEVEAAAVHDLAPARSLIIQLRCSPQTLVNHLRQRTTPVPDDWAVSFHSSWRDVDLSRATKIDVDRRTPQDVVDRIVSTWTRTEITDMILQVDDLVAPDGPEVELREVSPGNLPEVLSLVASGQESFVPYYESPPSGAVVCGVYEMGDLVGAVLLQFEPEARESPADAALAALVIAERHRGRGLATAAIGAAARRLGAAGFRRVIAEWVWSRPAYERLGFTVWRTRILPR